MFSSPSQSPLTQRHGMITPNLSRNNSDASHSSCCSYSSVSLSASPTQQFSPAHSPIQVLCFMYVIIANIACLKYFSVNHNNIKLYLFRLYYKLILHITGCSVNESRNFNDGITLRNSLKMQTAPRKCSWCIVLTNLLFVFRLTHLGK